MVKIASALLVHNKKLLLHLRDGGHPDPNLRNKWGLIGGTMEEGETPEETVRREIKEEASLTPKKVVFLQKLVIPHPSGLTEAHIFYAPLTDEEASHLHLGNEGAEVKFFPPAEVLKLPLSPEVKKYYSLHQAEIESLINADGMPAGRA